MTTTCNARRTINPLDPHDRSHIHKHFDNNDPDRTNHTCGQDKDQETNDHTGQHTCYICHKSFTTTGGEGPTRKHTVTETPRTVPNSLPATDFDSSEDVSPLNQRWDGGSGDGIVGTVRQFDVRPDRLRAEAAMADVRDLHDRTAALLASVINKMESRRLSPGVVADLRKVAVNLERLRPLTSADVVATLTRIEGVIEKAMSAAPKPASYMVDGLPPHAFRNDGSNDDQNACTWDRHGVLCGYAPNAMVHRRMSTRDAPTVKQ